MTKKHDVKDEKVYGAKLVCCNMQDISVKDAKVLYSISQYPSNVYNIEGKDYLVA